MNRILKYLFSNRKKPASPWEAACGMNRKQIETWQKAKSAELACEVNKIIERLK